MFPATIFNITDFGARPDGLTLCTGAFTAAIAACAAAGGGTVYVPGGIFLTGPVRLKSNITLYLDAGARVVFSWSQDDYPVIDSRWEGSACRTYAPQIYGTGLKNVTITGRGVLDGQGDYWWQVFRDRKLRFPRPRLISFEDCSNVTIEGVTLLNSPSWTINPILCRNVTIHRVTVENPADSPNTDGINPESCKNVHISDCHLDVGDDCIALKSGTEALTPRVPCENITITNCTMVHGHGGVVIGSEMSGDVRNVVISNCVFEGTDRGIRIKSRRGRGGVVEEIRVNNIIMKGVISPFVIHMYYHCGAGGKDEFVRDKKPHPVTEATPFFRGIHFSNITAKNVKAAAGFIYGLPEAPVTDLTFDNIAVEMASDAVPDFPAMMDQVEPMKKEGFFCCNAKLVSFSNIRLSGHSGPAFKVVHAEEVEFFRCQTGDTNDSFLSEQVKGLRWR